jgi:hypothetical protein
MRKLNADQVIKIGGKGGFDAGVKDKKITIGKATGKFQIGKTQGGFDAGLKGYTYNIKGKSKKAK